MTQKPYILPLFMGLLIIGSTAIYAKSPAPKASQTVFIPAPSPCHVIDVIKNQKIYLKTATKQCIQMLGQVKVTLPRDITSVDIYVDGSFWKKQKVQSFNQDDVRELMKSSTTMQNTTVIEENRFSEGGEKRAKALNQFFRSADYQSRLKEETHRIKQEVFNLPVAANAEEERTGKGRLLSSQERVYLFISSSMPMATLRNYIRDLDHIGNGNITVVMRGFINGMKQAGPTLQFVSEIMVKDPSCRVKESQCPARNINLVVDPLLFRKYSIIQVPALVYVPSQTDLDPEDSEGLGEAPPHYALLGDASLEYLLETLHQETQARSIKRLLTAFVKDGEKP